MEPLSPHALPILWRPTQTSFDQGRFVARTIYCKHVNYTWYGEYLPWISTVPSRGRLSPAYSSSVGGTTLAETFRQVLFPSQCLTRPYQPDPPHS